MTLNELRPVVHALPRQDKFMLVQELIAELADSEPTRPIEYPIWSPYDAHAAAAVMLEVLEREKAKNP